MVFYEADPSHFQITVKFPFLSNKEHTEQISLAHHRNRESMAIHRKIKHFHSKILRNQVETAPFPFHIPGNRPLMTILIWYNIKIEFMENILRIDESQLNNVTIVSLKGRMDASSSSMAETVLSRLIESGNREIVVDMSELDYISSAGLRVLLASLKRLREDDGRLLLAGMKPEVQHIFEIAGFQRIFTIYPTAEEAQNSFGAQE